MKREEYQTQNNIDNTRLKTFMVSADEDDDQLPDTYELRNGLDVSVNDADQDLDGDGISNLTYTLNRPSLNRSRRRWLL